MACTTGCGGAGGYSYQRMQYRFAIRRPPQAYTGYDLGRMYPSDTMDTYTLIAENPGAAQDIQEVAERICREMERERFERQTYRGTTTAGTYYDEAAVMSQRDYDRMNEILRRKKMEEMKPKHVCSASGIECSVKDIHWGSAKLRFHEGKLKFYRRMYSQIVKKHEVVCSSTMCLITRIEQEIYGNKDISEEERFV